MTNGRKFLMASICVASAAMLSGCEHEEHHNQRHAYNEPAGAEVMVAPAVPAYPNEAIPPSPGPGYVWVQGDWQWNGNGYAWRPGYWAASAHSGTRYDGIDC